MLKELCSWGNFTSIEIDGFGKEEGYYRVTSYIDEGYRENPVDTEIERFRLGSCDSIGIDPGHFDYVIKYLADNYGYDVSRICIGFKYFKVLVYNGESQATIKIECLKEFNASNMISDDIIDDIRNIEKLINSDAFKNVVQELMPHENSDC